MLPLLHRRRFLAASSSAVAGLAALGAGSVPARVDTRPLPTGPVSGRTGERGIRPGTAHDPSRGAVVLLDGRSIEVTHSGRIGVGPGRSVLIAPDLDGRWSILYAELPA